MTVIEVNERLASIQNRMKEHVARWRKLCMRHHSENVTGTREATRQWFGVWYKALCREFADEVNKASNIIGKQWYFDHIRDKDFD